MIGGDGGIPSSLDMLAFHLQGTALCDVYVYTGRERRREARGGGIRRGIPGYSTSIVLSLRCGGGGSLAAGHVDTVEEEICTRTSMLGRWN